MAETLYNPSNVALGLARSLLGSIAVVWILSSVPAQAQVSFNYGQTGNLCNDSVRGVTFGGGINSDDCDAGDNVGQASGIYFGGLTPFNAVSSIDLNGNFTVGGSFTVTGVSSPISFGGNRLQNVATPTAGTDAANKDYVDNANATQNTRITAVETVNSQQNNRLDQVETVNTQQDTRLTQVETTNTQQNTRLASLETSSTTQGQAITSLTNSVANINSQISGLSERDRELATGIAISTALDQPIFQPGQTFAMRVGYGDFDGFGAFGLTAAGVLSKNFAGTGTSVVIDGGIGTSTSNDMVAGKAGITLGW